MSGIAYGWALKKSPMLFTDKGNPDTTARFVLAALANHADDKGAGARPSVETLSAYTGFNVRTVQRALDRLHAATLIADTGWTERGVVIWQLSIDLDEETENFQRAADANRDRKDRDSAYRRGTRAPAGNRPMPEEPSVPTIPTSGFEVPTSGFSVPMSVPRTTGTLKNPLGTLNESSSGGTLPPGPLRPQDPPSSDLGTTKHDEISQTQDPHTGPTAQPPTARETAIAAIRAITRRPRTA